MKKEFDTGITFVIPSHDENGDLHTGQNIHVGGTVGQEDENLPQ